MAKKLTIELVPKSLWYSNLRSILSPKQWDILRQKCYRSAIHRCQICSKYPVECHEIWEYNDEKHIQKLVGLIALCPDCHMVKHFGLAQIQGNSEKAIQHIARINGWDIDETLYYIRSAFEKYEDRNRFEWKQDLDYLNNKNQLTLF